MWHCNNSCVNVLHFAVYHKFFRPYFYILQKGVAFYYFGSKFITWTVKLPGYNIRPSYRLKSIKQIFTSEVNTFLEEDISVFVTSFEVSVM